MRTLDISLKIRLLISDKKQFLNNTTCRATGSTVKHVQNTLICLIFFFLGGGLNERVRDFLKVLKAGIFDT